jgi:aspartyl-tRNA(Asn)/glutamyl-tRNA(Gln) amidotransferase subunit B
MEEDAGKSLHAERGESYSRVDLNRCGAPLIEIVSHADIRSPQEAYGYLTRLKQILQYTGVCTGDMEKGQLRCDANVSVRPVGQEKFGTRTELKNLNSFKGVERAITYEINRQVAELKAGGTITQATLLWNEAKQQAEMMRSKEDSHDYRYFPDPDLMHLHITDEWRESIRQSLPELPVARAARFVEQYGLRPYDGVVLTDTRALADYYEAIVKAGVDPTLASNWLQTEILGVINAQGKTIEEFSLTPNTVAALLTKIGSGELSGKMAKEVFAEMLATGKEAAAIIADKGLVQISDESAIEKICAEIIAANPDSLAKYKAGKTNLFAFFVGQTMKATKGQANPATVNAVLTRLLENS